MSSTSSQINRPAKDVSFYTPEQAPPAGTISDSENNIPAVFKPLKIRGFTFHNRIWVSPMCQYSAADGHLTDWHLVNIGSYAARGASLAMIEASAVEPEGRITPEDSGIWKDSHIAPIARIAEFMKSQGCVSAIQLAHAGRKASALAPWLGGTVADEQGHGWPKDVVGPSAIPYDETYSPVKELSVSRIQEIVEKFGQSATRAIKAGVQVIELHGAHGYLLHNFVSPLTNTRKDNYGGSFENRVRFPLECARAIKKAIDASGIDVPFFYRVSASDWVEGGWTCDDSVALAKLLQEEGIDLIDVSSAGNSTAQKIKTGPAYQVHFAEQIKREVPGLLVGSVGMIWRSEVANKVIDDGQADVVLVAREFLRDPSLVLNWAKELGVVVKYPIQYHRAAHPVQGAKFLGAGDTGASSNGVGGAAAKEAAEKHHGPSAKEGKEKL